MNPCDVCHDPDRPALYVYTVRRNGEERQERLCEPCSEDLVLAPQADWYLVATLQDLMRPMIERWDRETIGDAKFHELREDGLI